MKDEGRKPALPKVRRDDAVSHRRARGTNGVGNVEGMKEERGMISWVRFYHGHKSGVGQSRLAPLSDSRVDYGKY